MGTRWYEPGTSLTFKTREISDSAVVHWRRFQRVELDLGVHEMILRLCRQIVRKDGTLCFGYGSCRMEIGEALRANLRACGASDSLTVALLNRPVHRFVCTIAGARSVLT